MFKKDLAYTIAKKYKLNFELVMEISMAQLEDIFWNGWAVTGLKPSHYK
jgi:hypothetical protein